MHAAHRSTTGHSARRYAAHSHRLRPWHRRMTAEDRRPRTMRPRPASMWPRIPLQPAIPDASRLWMRPGAGNSWKRGRRFHLKYHNGETSRCPCYDCYRGEGLARSSRRTDRQLPAAQRKSNQAEVTTTLTSETIRQLTLIGGTFRHPWTRSLFETLRARFSSVQLSTRRRIPSMLSRS